MSLFENNLGRDVIGRIIARVTTGQGFSGSIHGSGKELLGLNNFLKFFSTQNPELCPVYVGSPSFSVSNL